MFRLPVLSCKTSISSDSSPCLLGLVLSGPFEVPPPRLKVLKMPAKWSLALNSYIVNVCEVLNGQLCPTAYKALHQGFPAVSVGKESACCAGDPGSVPGLGGSPAEGNGNPLQCSCLENPMDRRAWWVAVHGVARVGHDWATERGQQQKLNLRLSPFLSLASPPPPAPSPRKHSPWKSGGRNESLPGTDGAGRQLRYQTQ